MRINGLVLALFAVCFVGCSGSSGPVTAPVSGKVTLNGEPLPDATINFATENFVGSARTGSDGSYSLVTGAALGENKVWIEEKFDAPEGFDDDPEAGMDRGQLDAMNVPDEGGAEEAAPMATQIPAEYGSFEETILKVIVNDGGTDSANFDLQASN